MPRPARIKAVYFDGKSSQKHRVILCVDANGNSTLVNDGEQALALPPLPHCSRLNISDRVGNTARTIQLPGGGILEMADNEAVDQLSDDWHSSRRTLAHRLEHNLKIVWASIAGLLAGGFLFVMFGIPAISAQVTQWLPTSLDEQMASQAMEQLDASLFSPSELHPERQRQLQVLFESLSAGIDRDFQLLFRRSDQLGANAIALPDGTIVFTDDLVNLAYLDNPADFAGRHPADGCRKPDDDEGDDESMSQPDSAGDETNDSTPNPEAEAMIAAIMQHEIGHVIHRHAVQNTVRQAGLAALIVAVTGDVGTASSLILLMPTVLVQAQYSQEFEWESDTYALEQMLARDEDPIAFAQIMSRMAYVQTGWIEQHGDGEEALDLEPDSTSVWERLVDMLSTHPSTRERIERFEQASEAFNAEAPL